MRELKMRLPAERRGVLLALVLLLSLWLVEEARACGRDNLGNLYCPVPGTLGEDIDHDGASDLAIDMTIEGDNPQNPRCKLYCLSNSGRIPLFLLKCGDLWLHRCPYKGAANSWKLVNGKYRGGSTESEYAVGEPSDDDHDGVIERVEYREIMKHGDCMLEIRTYHDGKLVEPVKIVPCPTSISKLPWPVEPPDAEDNPVLPTPWMVVLLATVVGIVAFRLWRRDRRLLDA